MKKFLVIIMLFLSIKLGSQTPISFIDKYDELSIELMKEYKIPASVILGISMLESGSGTSKLSSIKNNFFGIKSKGRYRSYKSDIESFNDFCKLISTNKIYKKNIEYLITNDIIEYKLWLEKISKSGYSQTADWTDRIVKIINKYKLYELDLV